jgi:hypothetical protein
MECQVRQEQEFGRRSVLRLLLHLDELPEQGRRLKLRLQLSLLHHGLSDDHHSHCFRFPQVQIQSFKFVKLWQLNIRFEGMARQQLTIEF